MIYFKGFIIRVNLLDIKGVSVYYINDMKIQYCNFSLIQSDGDTEDLRSHGNPFYGRCQPERVIEQ